MLIFVIHFMRNLIFTYPPLFITHNHYMKSIRALLATTIIAASGNAWAEAPAGYYSSCEGQKGAGLLKALQSTVGSHTQLSYDGVWTAFRTTDINESGRLIDMYSTKLWSVSEKCGNYSKVGDCYNREHSFPKSWFDDRKPMYTDINHLYPTDGKVNGQRSNHPFGECANGTTLSSTNGVKALGKLGTSTFPGYSGTVFEPADEYKGDFARTYFYMAAAYNSSISTWHSDMLAGNAYPAYKTWAVNLLLKWHRQDPVSDKERKRNDAVYKEQGNRNPFIDHPDMAEHIWGDAVNQGWSATQATDQIVLPVDGQTLTLGNASTSKPRTFKVAIQTAGATSAVTLSVSGNGYTINPTSISAATANAGTTATVTLNAPTTGTYRGTLTVKCGESNSTAPIVAQAYDGIGLTVSDISDDGFEVRWINLEAPGTAYQLHVEENVVSLEDYPETVDAADESYFVSGLDSETTYTCYLTSPTFRSNVVTATTAALIPTINVTTTGSTDFLAAPGTASLPIEMEIDAVNIPGNIYASTSNTPFELSADKTSWSREITLLPGENRFYLRAYSDTEGNFTGSLTVSGGTAEWDCDLTANIVAAATFVEDFETMTVTGSYADTDFTTDVAKWHRTNILLANTEAYEGDNSLRFGKLATSTLTLADNIPSGIGTVSFYAVAWNKDGDATIHVETSTDGGITWQEAKQLTVTEGAYTKYSATANVAAPSRFRIRQSKGGRMKLDYIEVTPPMSATDEVTADSDADNTWDIFCLDGQLVIENHKAGNRVSVYDINGNILYEGTPAVGYTTLHPAPGLYIGATDSRARRVLVH